MRKRDLHALKKQEADVLAKIWCQLNRREWPEEIPYPESLKKYYDGDPRLTRGWQIMRWIEDAIGERQISRVSNKEMSDEAFEDFWRGFHEGDRKAHARYMARTWLRVAEEEDD